MLVSWILSNSRNFCSNIFLLSLMILWFSWRMIVLAVLLLLEKRGLTAPHTHKNTHRHTHTHNTHLHIYKQENNKREGEC